MAVSYSDELLVSAARAVLAIAVAASAEMPAKKEHKALTRVRKSGKGGANQGLHIRELIFL
jgi:hypothetical protein